MGRNNQNDRQRQLMSILPRYALRKTKLGCVSMLIAVGFFLGGANELNVKADALPAQNGKTATVQSKAPSADYESLAAAADSFTASVNEKSDYPAKTSTTSAASVAANVAADNSDSKVSCDALGDVQAENSTDDSAVVYQNSSALVSSSARGQADAAISNSADSAQNPSMVMASAAQKVSEPTAVQGNATEPSLSNTTGAVINDPSLPAEDVTVDAKNFNHYFDMHGTATDQLNSDGSVTITFTKKGQQYSAGGISLKEKINMDSSFTLNGQINLGNFGGADGMGIVFHTGNVAALGRPGGNLGIAGCRMRLALSLIPIMTTTMSQPRVCQAIRSRFRKTVRMTPNMASHRIQQWPFHVAISLPPVMNRLQRLLAKRLGDGGSIIKTARFSH